MIETMENNATAAILADTATLLRGTLSDMRVALNRIAPEASRNRDAELDERASYLTRSFFQMLRLASNIESFGLLMACNDFTLIDQDVVGLCRNLCNKAEPYFALKGVALTFHTNRTAKRLALHAEWFERALLNLMENALRATSYGDTVSVRVFCDKKEVTIMVADTGRGIPDDQLETIFERKELRLNTTDPKQGLGLGLPICRRIVDGLGGTLTASSGPCMGSSFTITLPNEHSKLTLFHEMQYDYAGGFDHILVELSNALPATAYQQRYLG